MKQLPPAAASVRYAMKLDKLVLLLGSLAALLLLVACAGTGGGSGASSTAARDTKGQGAQPADARAQGSAQPTPAGPAPATVPATTIPEGPRVQRSARISLEVPTGRFDSVLNDVIGIVDQAGGYISGSQAQAGDGQRAHSGQVTFQVPADKFDTVLTELRKRGTPQNITISGNDVSQQYVDLQARLRNVEAQRNAILALMTQAKSVGDTIQIQNQLGQVTGQIEEIKGRIDFLEHSTNYATVSVDIHEAPAGPRDEWGLQTAAIQGLHNFVSVIAVVVLTLATIAPLLIGALVLGLAARSAWRRFGPGQARGGPAASATGE